MSCFHTRTGIAGPQGREQGLCQGGVLELDQLDFGLLALPRSGMGSFDGEE